MTTQMLKKGKGKRPRCGSEQPRQGPYYRPNVDLMEKRR